ncbi:hypothetical protein NFI96_007049 [Prochilodus magdalenae]|nr:hypothetical protein NFI96_007049 [Prochilodus magdalenae]
MAVSGIVIRTRREGFIFIFSFVCEDESLAGDTAAQRLPVLFDFATVATALCSFMDMSSVIPTCVLTPVSQTNSNKATMHLQGWSLSLYLTDPTATIVDIQEPGVTPPPPQPHSLQELCEDIQAAWDGLSQDTIIRNLYTSMLRRLRQGRLCSDLAPPASQEPGVRERPQSTGESGKVGLPSSQELSGFRRLPGRVMGQGERGARTAWWRQSVPSRVWRLVLVCCGIHAVHAQTSGDSKSLYFWETGCVACSSCYSMDTPTKSPPGPKHFDPGPPQFRDVGPVVIKQLGAGPYRLEDNS